MQCGFFPDFVSSLSVNRIDILKPVKHGETLCLKCIYRINRNEEFRGVRWYRNDDIIYTYAIGGPDPDSPKFESGEPYKIAYGDHGLDVDACISICAHLNWRLLFSQNEMFTLFVCFDFKCLGK